MRSLLIFTIAALAIGQSRFAAAQCLPNPNLEYRLIALAPTAGGGSFYFVVLDQQPALNDLGRVGFAAEARIDFNPRQGVCS